jgi:hypothetical protein
MSDTSDDMEAGAALYENYLEEQANKKYMDNQKPETIFADGMMFNRKHENAPAFVLGSVSFKVDDFIAFLQKHRKADGWLNVDMLKPQDATKKPYFKLNTWEKPADASSPVTVASTQAVHRSAQPVAAPITAPNYPEEDINPEDIPFN